MAIIQGQNPGQVPGGFVQPIDVVGGTPNQGTDTQPIIGTPLTTAPQYGGAGGSQQAAEYYAYQDFVKTFGRPPTQAELDQAANYYVGTDPNRANLAAGNSYIANYFQQQHALTAIQLQQQQNQQGLAAYQKGQQGFDQTTSQAFQSLIGRAPTQAELQHFGTLLATGQTDGYGLSQYLQSTPEYQQTQYNNFAQKLGGQLNDINGQFFNQYVQPSIMSQFAQQGRDISGASTGLQFALANSAKQMQLDTQQYLANLGGQAYLGSQGEQAQNYQAQLAQQMGVQNTSLGNSLSNQNALQGQNWGALNNQIQSQNLMNYLSHMGGGSQNNNAGYGRLAGSLAGAGIGAALGGPAGAGLGMQLGGSFGQTAGGLWG